MSAYEQDCIDARAEGRKWARIALNNRANGEPWHDAAKLAHEAFRWALLITGRV